MNIGDYVKVERFTKEITEETAELLLGNIFPVVNKVTDDEYEVLTSKGKRSVFNDEVQVLISENQHLSEIDKLETEIARLKEQLEEITEHRDQLIEDLHNVTGGK